MQDLIKQTVNRYPVYEQQYTVIFVLFLLREIFIAHTNRKHIVYINSSVYHLLFDIFTAFMLMPVHASGLPGNDYLL